MDAPLTHWYCDTCGKQIVSAKDGYVIWKDTGSEGPRSYRIIHHGRCDRRGEYNSSAALVDFLGADGFATATALISVGTVIRNRGVGSVASGDVDDWVDFVRRVQLPYYEEARRCFNNPEYREEMSDANEVAPYLEENLKRTIRRFGGKA